MKRICLTVVAVAICLSASTLWSQEKQAAAPAKKAPRAAPAEDDYRPGPDSQKQPGVPSGKQFQFKFDESHIFPGTTRGITVYVPAQYKADKPACVYIGLDALGFGVPVVFDNLIHKQEMPVTIAVGISSGQVASSDPPNDPRFNRSFEFDGMNGNLARSVLEEILPEVEKHQTPDGLPIRLSKDPNDRCTGGGSTGGIGAFTLAWERPDSFRRVFTAIGTFVGMRGGDRYPVLIRKTEPKPLRIFMQDGSSDQWGGGPEVGDWWNGNQGVQRALEFSGYQVEHVWGTGGHSGRHATAIFPDAMRWLWKDWPKPIEAGESENHFLQDILEPGETWKETSGGATESDTISATGPDGESYTADAQAGTIVADSGGKKTTIAAGIHARGLLVTHSGNIYASEPAHADGEPGTIWLIKHDGKKEKVDGALNHPSVIAISPDGLWLIVAESGTHWAYSFRVQPDGTLKDRQKFYWFHVPDWADDSGVRELRMDREGRLYAATRMGVQVLDRNGRVRAILPVPGNEVTGISFGGEKFNVLHVSSGGKIFERKMKVPGMPPATAPVKLPGWGAG